MMKVSLSLIIAALLFWGPYSDFVPYSAYWSAHRDFWLWNFVYNNFISIKYIIIALCFLCLPTSRYTFIPVCSLAILFGIFNWFCSVDSPGGLYNYNTHLNIFLVGLVLVLYIRNKSEKYSPDAEEKFFQFCQCYILIFYLQSGISKIFFAGTTWLMTGRTAWVFTLELGTDFGKLLAHYPLLFAVGSFLIVAFEIIILPLYLLKVWRRPLILGMVFLHLSVFAVMGISFWHMWLLYPIVFFKDLFPLWHKKKQPDFKPMQAPIT